MVVEPNLDYSLPLLGGLMALLVLAYANRFLASPALAIILRWGRWAAFSFGAAYLVQSFGWSGRPYWVLVLSAFLIWVLLETLYTWFAISALSLSPIPLFPRFSANQTGEEDQGDEEDLILCTRLSGDSEVDPPKLAQDKL